MKQPRFSPSCYGSFVKMAKWQIFIKRQIRRPNNNTIIELSYPKKSWFVSVSSGHWRHDYLIKYAYFDKMLFRTVCFYQWSWKLNYKCSLMALAIWVHFRSSNFRHVTDNWESTLKIFILKWWKDNERATSSFRYISEAIEKVLINSPCTCVYVI